MHFDSIISQAWKTTTKTVVGIFSLFVIVLILPKPVDASQTALVRASDGNVYRIRFTTEGYNTSDFIDNFSIYDETGTVELCPGNDQGVTRELYTAARVLEQTPRNTPLFDTSPLAATLEQTAAELGIDREGNVDVVGIVGDIVAEMAGNEVQGHIQAAVEPSLNLGIATINLKTFKIKINASGPDILVKPTEFLSRFVGLEIELRWMLYAFSRASTYANTTIHLQALANQRAAALWDAINAGEVIDITGHAFTIHEDTIEISNKIGVFDPLRLRLAAGVYRAYAEYVAELGTDLAEHEGPVATLANRISVDIITEFLFTLSDAQSAIAEKDALDELDAQIPGDINTRLHANINGIYDSATSDLTQHGFCAPDVRFTAIPPTVPEGDTLTYTVALNSAPAFVAIISITSNNPDVTVSPTSLTFTPSNWYIPKRVVVDVSADADSIDESGSLRHVIVGYGGGMVREFQFDITDQVSNRAPRPTNTIPDQSLTVGDPSEPLALPTYFNDPDNDTLTYTIVSSDPNVAIVQRAGAQFTVWTLNVGNTTVTVRATDPDGLFATQTFNVTVAPAPVQQRPEQVGTIATQYMTLDGGARTVDIASYFTSPNPLRYEISSSPLGFVTASISGSQVTITPLQAGSASVFVTARDSQNPDLSAIQTIPVSVSHAIIVRPPTPEPFTPPTTNPDVEGLREGISVITQLTAGSRLNVRERPGTDEEILEQLGSGVIGTITDGPVRADNFRWWEIEWEIGGIDLEGWSAESDRGQILFRRPPDLEIQDLDVSEDEVEPGDRFTVEVRVRNNGPGESAATELSVYYSLSRHSSLSDFNADSHKYEVGTINIPSLRAGRRTERSLRVTAPRTPDRYYYGGLLPSNIHPTDYTRDLPADARENDLASQERVEVTTAPDLIIASISSDTSVLDPGETFRLEVTVRNQGIGEPENNTTLRYYRSPNAGISSSDTEVGTDSVYRGNLDTNGSEDESISLTAPGEPGVYYYGACVDGVEHESNTRNNCSGAVAITVREPAPAQTPDLVPSVPTVSTNALAPGAAFTLETIVENRGMGTSGNTVLRWYQSTDPNISPNDTEVGNALVRSLASGQTIPYQLTFNAPTTAGTYYYGVGVESVTDESDTTNNYSIGVAVTVENRPPSAVGTLPSRTLSENDAPIVVDVAAYFNDPDNTPLTYTAVSDSPAVVTTEISGSEMTITPVGAGNASVVITASDGTLTATQTFSVTIIAAPTKNEAPVAVGTILTQSLTLDGGAVTVDFSAYFSDANGDTLTYAAWPDDKSIVTLQRQGTLLTITPKAAGRATVTVRATDPDGLQAFQRISVFVRTTEGAELPAGTWMPDANLRTSVRKALGLAPNAVLTQQALQSLTSLRYLGLDLSDNEKITDLTGLEHALNLEHLDLYRHLISDLRPLARLAKLESLWLAGNKIANIRPLTNLPLEELDLGSNPINNFAPLSELTSLTRLDFWGNGLGDNDLSSITGLTQLTQLNLGNNKISDVTPLTKLVNLTKLRLKGNPISDTAPLRELLRQNPDLEIDIEISDEPPSKPDTEIASKIPDLIVESVRVNKTAVDPGEKFRLDAVVRNQGKAASGAATIHFYRSVDETISAEDTQLKKAPVPAVAVDSTGNKWAQLTAPNTQGVYYYGVCISNVANEGDTGNNCSTAVKITVGTVPAKPPTVEKPTPAPETGEDPPQADLLAKQVLQKHGRTLRRRDVIEVLPNVLTTLKEPDIQKLLIPATINLVIKDPDLLKTMVPTISDKFITLLKTDAEIKTLLSDSQVQTLLQTPAAIDELAKLLGISAAPPSTPAPGGTVVFRDANLAKRVREILNIAPGAPIRQGRLATLTWLKAEHYKITDLTGLESATALADLYLWDNSISDISVLSGLTSLKGLDLNGNKINNSDLSALSGLTSLYHLELTNNSLSDLSALSGLTSLGSLFLRFNLISDLSALSGLTRLKRLGLTHNLIRDISVLSGMTSLEMLDLQDNSITNVRALQGLTSLRVLLLEGNPGITDFQPLRVLRTAVEAQGVTVVDNLRSANLAGYPQEVQAAQRNYMTNRRAKPVAGYLLIDVNIDVAGAAPTAPVIPDETALLPNYPNPFNPETWMPYQLAKATDVTLTIYDVRGVVVRRLALGHQPAGFYQNRARAAYWDGRNGLGERVASGLYFYTFRAGDFTTTRKMLIRK